MSARRMWTEVKKTSSWTFRKDLRFWKRLKITRSDSERFIISSDCVFWMMYLQKLP